MSLIRSRPGRKSLVTPSEGKALWSAMDGMRRLAAARLGEADLAPLRAYVRTHGRDRDLNDDELRDLVAAQALLGPAIVATLGAGLTRNPRWRVLEAAVAKLLAPAPAPAPAEEPN